MKVKIKKKIKKRILICCRSKMSLLSHTYSRTHFTSSLTYAHTHTHTHYLSPTHLSLFFLSLSLSPTRTLSHSLSLCLSHSNTNTLSLTHTRAIPLSLTHLDKASNTDIPPKYSLSKYNPDIV